MVGRLLFTLGNEPEWVLEFERQERRVATEMRKREMEERIARVRAKERKEKLAVKKGLGQVTKKRVLSDPVRRFDGRKSCRRRKRRNFFWESIIQMTRLRNLWILRMLLEEGILLLKYSKCYNNKWPLPPLK